MRRLPCFVFAVVGLLTLVVAGCVPKPTPTQAPPPSPTPLSISPTRIPRPPVTATRLPTLTPMPPRPPTRTPTTSPTDTPGPTATPCPTIPVGQLDPWTALQALYGTDWVSESILWHSETDWVRWQANEIPAGTGHDSCWQGTLYSTVYQAMPFRQNDAERYYLLTKTIQPQCTGGDGKYALGGAIFSRVGDGWQVDVVQPYITWLRTFRLGREAEWLVRLGPDHYGMLLLHLGWGTGFGLDEFRLVTEIDGQIQMAFVPDHSLGGWEDELGIQVHPCGEDLRYGYCMADSSLITLVPGDNPDYYDLEALTQGTWSRVKRYVFSPGDQAYVLATPDPTTQATTIEALHPQWAVPAAGPPSTPALAGRNWLTDVAWSPDGRRLAVGTSQGMHLYDANTLEEVYRLEPLRLVESLSFSPDGALLAIGLGDGTVQLWQVATQKVVGILEESPLPIGDVAFSPDGHYLAATLCAGWPLYAPCTVGGTWVWDTAEGSANVDEWRQAAVLEGPAGDVRRLAFSPDGRFLAAAGDDGVRLWTIGDWQQRQWPGPAQDVAFAPDGTLAAAFDRQVRLLDPISGDEGPLLPAHGHRVWSVAFSPDGQYLFSGSDGEEVRLWDMARSSEAWNKAGVHLSYIEQAVYSPDGTRLATISWTNPVRLWSMPEGEKGDEIQVEGVEPEWEHQW